MVFIGGSWLVSILARTCNWSSRGRSRPRALRSRPTVACSPSPALGPGWGRRRLDAAPSRPIFLAVLIFRSNPPGRSCPPRSRPFRSQTPGLSSSPNVSPDQSTSAGTRPRLEMSLAQSLTRRPAARSPACASASAVRYVVRDLRRYDIQRKLRGHGNRP
jgi:hypothetical protein